MRRILNDDRGAALILELVLVALILSVVGFIGYRAYQSGHKTQVATPITTQPAPSSTPTTTQEQVGYLVIKEWGVKIKMKDAAKLTYDFNSTPGDGYDSGIGLKLKPEYLQDKTCNIGVGMSRSKNPDPALVEDANKVGEYYFLVNGSPYHCNAADDSLNQGVRSDFTVKNIQAL